MLEVEVKGLLEVKVKGLPEVEVKGSLEVEMDLAVAFKVGGHLLLEREVQK